MSDIFQRVTECLLHGITILQNTHDIEIGTTKILLITNDTGIPPSPRVDPMGNQTWPFGL